MTLEQLVGQHLIVGVAGHSLTSEERRFIVDNNIGGVILFGRNVSTPEQVAALCTEIQNLHLQTVSRIPLTISIDMEGGRVHRLKDPFTQWPPLRNLGNIDSPQASFQFSYLMGLELRACGINLDYAPVLDVFTNPENKVIGDRSISNDPEMVAKHSSALVRGYLKAGVIPCGKHFPGHGNTLIDSHEDLPIEHATLERLHEVELIPFKKAFKSGLELLMTSHILFPKIDPEWPGTLSEILLRRVLREDLRYRGLVISDDLDMKALAKNYDRKMIPVRALQAGVDILLYCNEPESPPRAISSVVEAIHDGWIDRAQMESSLRRIVDFKKEYLNGEQIPKAELRSCIGSVEHKTFAQSIRDGKVPLLKPQPSI